MTTILTKRSNTPGAVPVTANLTNAAGGAELAVNTADKRLFTLNSANNVVEVGTNPSSLTCADVSATVLRAGSATITNLIATSASITTLTNNPTLSGGTANGVLYLNGSKVATSGSALTFDGTNLALTTANSIYRVPTAGGYLFDAGGNNGIYILGSSNYVAAYTGGTERMRLDSSGNLGLGVTPSAWLVTSGIRFLEILSTSGFGDNGGSTTVVNNGYRDASGWKYRTTNFASRYETDTGQHRWLTAPSGTAGNTISFTQAMTLNASSQLLVNQTASGGSAAKLQVGGANGSTNAGAIFAVEKVSEGYGLYVGVEGSGASFIQAGTANDSTYYNLHLQRNGGNLGIGTTSPEAILHVAKSTSGGIGGQLVLDNNASTALNNATEISFLNESGASGSGTRNARIRSIITNAGDAASALQFYTWSGSTDAERARITAGGNLLVGTLTDLGYAARLDVDSAGGETAVFKSSGGASSYVQRVWNSATSGDNLFVWFGTEAGGTTRGSITYNRGAGQVAYNVTSDARLKENIADAEEAGSKIDAMQVRQFDWKETKNHLDYGFVAQELHAVAPHAVSKPEDEEAMWSVDYSKLVPMLVKEIQSLRSRVAALEAK